LNEILFISGLVLGPDNSPIYDITHKKMKPKTKKIFS